jgi:hypothetical protein
VGGCEEVVVHLMVVKDVTPDILDAHLRVASYPN